MGRAGAFLIHLAISLVIFLVLAALLVFVWYPGFYFESDGGWQGIRIIAFVDIVLGPLLTLVVFNRKKPARELRRDLTIIGVFQAACLTAGVYVVYSERPIALVYTDGQFLTMSADDYTNVGARVPDLSELPGPSPKRIVLKLPADFAEQSDWRRKAFAEGRPLRTYSQLYEPLSYADLNVDKDSAAPALLRERDSDAVERWLREHGGTMDDYAFFSFGARYGYTFLGVSRKNREIVGVLDIPRLTPPRAGQSTDQP